MRVLELAQALKFLQVGQITVAVDGTKVLAHASKHAAVSYAHAGKTIQQLDLEVKELLAKSRAGRPHAVGGRVDHSPRSATSARAQRPSWRRRGQRLKRAPKPGPRRKWPNTGQVGRTGGR